MNVLAFNNLSFVSVLQVGNYNILRSGIHIPTICIPFWEAMKCILDPGLQTRARTILEFMVWCRFQYWGVKKHSDIDTVAFYLNSALCVRNSVICIVSNLRTRQPFRESKQVWCINVLFCKFLISKLWIIWFADQLWKSSSIQCNKASCSRCMHLFINIPSISLVHS